MEQLTMPFEPQGLPTGKSLRMPEINHVRLAGRLTHDPEVRTAIGDRMIVHLNLAVNRRYQSGTGQNRQEATFVTVTVWNPLAEFCTNNLVKGSAIYLEGKLRSDQWNSSDGEKHSALRVEARRIELITKSNSARLTRPTQSLLEAA